MKYDVIVDFGRESGIITFTGTPENLLTMANTICEHRGSISFRVYKQSGDKYMLLKGCDDMNKLIQYLEVLRDFEDN